MLVCPNCNSDCGTESYKEKVSIYRPSQRSINKSDEYVEISTMGTQLCQSACQRTSNSLIAVVKQLLEWEDLFIYFSQVTFHDVISSFIFHPANCGLCTELITGEDALLLTLSIPGLWQVFFMGLQSTGILVPISILCTFTQNIFLSKVMSGPRKPSLLDILPLPSMSFNI